MISRACRASSRTYGPFRARTHPSSDDRELTEHQRLEVNDVECPAARVFRSLIGAAAELEHHHGLALGEKGGEYLPVAVPVSGSPVVVYANEVEGLPLHLFEGQRRVGERPPIDSAYCCVSLSEVVVQRPVVPARLYHVPGEDVSHSLPQVSSGDDALHEEGELGADA